jgi:hypothetical protein
MGDTWKAIERAVAALVDGERTWNSDEDIDVQTEGWALEVKHLKAPSVADLERILIHNAPKAAAVGKGNALVVKRAAGRGRPSFFLAVFPLDVNLAHPISPLREKP